MTIGELNPQLVEHLVSEGVDLDRMLRFLDDLNSGKYDNQATVVPETVPSIDNPAIVDRTKPASFTMALSAARSRFEELGIELDPAKIGRLSGAASNAAGGARESAGATRAGSGGSASDETVTFDESALRLVGIHLYPKTAYGVLNGGSASSYADFKKNREYSDGLFDDYRDLFERLASECRGRPKGITPAYINPDGSAGYSFLLLKLRMLLEHRKLYADTTGRSAADVLPSFQMTSVHTDGAIGEAFRDYVTQPELKSLADALGCPSIQMFTETQTMMAAITHSSEGTPRRIFDRANGKPNTGIAMPGGHGQNFEILAPIYRRMHSLGIRYAWIGNIDNMGFTVDPVSLAIFALSGKEAAFEESWRTPMDVKGGILVSDRSGKLTCADIGPAISTADVLAFEKAGKPVLFNCGVGLFDLDRLIPRLDDLPYKLPLRVTNQDKDAGRYAQAEQITWEIIGLLDDPLFFAVDKTKRFLAAKMLMENILTSLPPKAAEGASAGADAQASVSAVLHEGLSKLLLNEYGLVLQNNRWKLPLY